MYARESAVSTGGTGKGTNKLRRDWGTFAQPQPPPLSLPDSHAETANRFLRKRDWQLTKSVADGSWILGRVPNF
jgi:hypothetical protein